MYDNLGQDVHEVLSYSEQFQRLKGSKDYDILLTVPEAEGQQGL